MSNQINDGGPAFPGTRQIRSGGCVIDTEEMPGMSLRAYMATEFMSAQLSRTDAKMVGVGIRPDIVPIFARDACFLADALIEELSKKGTPEP